LEEIPKGAEGAGRTVRDKNRWSTDKVIAAWRVSPVRGIAVMLETLSGMQIGIAVAAGMEAT
jgi:hypothetical protein